MRLATRPAPAGFSLVELLVVLSIIVVLLALSGAALQKAADSQRNRSTDDLMNRLQPALDTEYEAVIKQSAKDRQTAAASPLAPANATFMSVVAYCDNNFDRAQSLWTNAQLRRQFPQSFAEAATAVSGVSVYPGGPTLPGMSTFSPVSAFTSSPSNPDYESAALLYLILSKKSSGNSAGFAADDVTNGVQMDLTFSNGKAKAFRDIWGHPICFYRWWTGAEVQAAPYVDPKKLVNNTAYLDPLDPPMANAAPMVFGWSNTTKKQALAAAPYLFTNVNRVATVYSYGKNGINDSLVPTSDDRAGFRLRRLGNKGD